MNKSGQPALGVGVITIFMILLVLALTTFSMLTFSSAYADLRLSRLNTSYIAAYYQADSEALKAVSVFAADDTTIAGDELEATFPMADTKTKLQIHVVKNEDNTVDVLSWNTIPTDDDSAILEEDTLLGRDYFQS